jgi:hypothetical protein
MREEDIRVILRKIKTINKRCIALFFAQYDTSDNDISSYKDIMDGYIYSIKDLIGSVNKVESKRILKALGFEEDTQNRFLVPVNAISLIDDGTELIALTGEKEIVGVDEIDTDSRNGMLGYYMVFPKIGK